MDGIANPPQTVVLKTKPDLQPVQPSERIELLDVLRGFALIGVLYVNMHDFGQDEIVGAIHSAARFFMLTIFESKFFSLFSLLFGMGFAIQLRRASARGVSLFSIYWRRLVVLFAFGWLHAAIYPGDILRLYAILGFALFLFRDWPVRRLVWMAIMIYAVDIATWLLFRSDIIHLGLWGSDVAGESVDAASAAAADAARASRAAAYRSGSFVDVATANLVWMNKWIRQLEGYGPSALGLFLLGLAAVKSGILDNMQSNRPFLKSLGWWMLCVGLPGAVWDSFVAAYDVEMTSVAARASGSILYGISYPTLMIAYVCFIALRFPYPVWRRVLHPLAAVGRMALTVYVVQSLIYTTIFYGYGLGMYARIGPAYLIPMTIVIFSLEILACNWWLTRYRYGPLEWLWRSLTYWKRQPIRA